MGLLWLRIQMMRMTTMMMMNGYRTGLLRVQMSKSLQTKWWTSYLEMFWEKHLGLSIRYLFNLPYMLLTSDNIWQIRASPQAKQYFALCCKSEQVPILELIKWIRTRWGSMHDLVDRFTSLKPVYI